MAVRQYIGARYVPLYAGDWDATRNYEPLTIVTDANGNSFTSLKDVPAGTALTDRNYWIQTSSFSGAVDSLQRRVNSVESDVSTLQSDVSGAQTSISTLQSDMIDVSSEISKMNYSGKKVLIIGDSLCDEALQQSSPNWVTHFRNRVLSDGGEVTNFSFSGIGITDAVTPTIQTKLNDIPEGNYTDVMVWLGCNDWSMGATFQQIRSQFANLANRLLDIAPNSRKWFVLPHRWKNSRVSDRPLTYYSFVFTKFCANRWGYYVVNPAVELPDCNPNIQRLSNLVFVSDTDQHFKPAYAPILAEYFYNRLLKQVSSGGDEYTVPLRLTPVLGGSTIDSFAKADGAVTLSISLSGVTTASNPQRLATLPEWARPLVDLQVEYHPQKSNGDLASAYLQINSNGSVFFVGDAAEWRFNTIQVTFETLAGLYTVD